MPKSKIFFYCCLSFVAGIFTASFLLISLRVIIAGVAIAAILMIDKKTLLAGGFLLLFLFGILRCNAGFRIGENSIAGIADGNTHIIKGIVAKEPDERLKYINLTVRPKYLNGLILVRTEKYSGFHYGDEIIIDGKLEIPKEGDDFSWRGYLMRYGIQAVALNPKISLVSLKNGNWAYSFILLIKQYFRKKIKQFVPGAKADFLSALLLGYKGNISQYWKDVFSKTGTSHIISISGLHISIIAGAILFLLLGVGISRNTAFWAVLSGIAGYAVLAGMTASVIRASIMGFLVLLAIKAGRISKPRNALVFAAAVMLIFNPLLLRYDAGFQLSFLSVAGIFYLQPILERWTGKIPNPLKLRSVFNLSLSAQIAALPLVIYYFKLVSLIAPVANLMVVMLIPFIFMIGLVPLALAFLPRMFCSVLFLPYKEVSGFVLRMLEWMAKAPIIKITINAAALSIIYIAMFAVILIANRKGADAS